MRRFGALLVIFLVLAGALSACGVFSGAPQAQLTATPSPQPTSGLQFYEFYSPL
jgi:hypothetical protein